ncbi:MAG: S41 family peptidase [Planctomycetota bacterium]
MIDGCPRTPAALIVAFALVVPPAAAAPPTVVSITPEHGAANVDPALAELRVEFDQDMAGGFSWTGGGPTFPEVIGRPRWVTPRSCVLSVRLQSNHEYRIGLNSPSHHNFRSQAGEALAPYPLWFRTAAAPGDEVSPEIRAAARPVRGEENRESVETLRRAIDERYSYRDRLGLDWDALFEAHGEALLNADTPYRFAAVAGRLLAAAEDVHVGVEVGGSPMPGYQRVYEPNYNIPAVGRRLRGLKQWSNDVLSGWLDDEVGYLCIATWQRDREASVRPAFDALRELIDARAIIIDVRPNGGGDEMLAQEFAGCFVDEPVVYARHVNREPAAPGGFSRSYDRVLRPNPQRARYRGRVVVLMGPGNLSSAEAFLLMMRQVEGSTLLGMRSGGSSGRPRPVTLPNGVVVRLSSWKAMAADGTAFEGVGIEPDVEFDVEPGALRGGDPTIGRALEWLDQAAPGAP